MRAKVLTMVVLVLFAGWALFPPTPAEAFWDWAVASAAVLVLPVIATAIINFFTKPQPKPEGKDGDKRSETKETDKISEEPESTSSVIMPDPEQIIAY